jgi:aconitate hydratase
MAAFDYTRKELQLSNGRRLAYYSLAELERRTKSLAQMPIPLRILLESLLRNQHRAAYSPAHVESFLDWSPDGARRSEFPFLPARILLQDFTGVPAVVDVAALRSALARAGMDPGLVEPEIAVDLVIDHSIQIDQWASPEALDFNMAREFERNSERYRFLRWGQNAFQKLRILPPGLGICHQVNMELLASCVATGRDEVGEVAFPDSLVGTDSHTPMINCMGVLGWGVGGIEAEAAMLGQPIPLLSPLVTGMRLVGEPRPGVTPTDIVLGIVELLRQVGVVGHFVDYFGPGVQHLALVDRAPIANMTPEYGATMGFFAVDQATLDYLRETGRTPEQVDLVERYCKEQGLWRAPDAAEAQYSKLVEFDLAAVEPCVAGPRKPQERIPIGQLGDSFARDLAAPVDSGGFGHAESASAGIIKDGDVAIASITSCTNTSNPSLMFSAGLMARKAVERGMKVPEQVKTSFAPGSRVVTEYLRSTGLLAPLAQLGFDIVCYGCATCIGNSGPLRADIEQAIKEQDLIVASVLSGNRNFEGRVHPLTQANYLASPPLVLAYALAGTVRIDIEKDPIGVDTAGQPVYLRDIWPSRAEIDELLGAASEEGLYERVYSQVEGLNPMWDALPSEQSAVYEWDPDSTYVREPGFFADFQSEAPGLRPIEDAAVLALFGDFITTDHISPAGAIPADSPAARYLREHGVAEADFNSFGSRRGNHEVMMRGTFGNIRIRNRLVEGSGGRTVYHPDGSELPIYDAAMKYHDDGTPLVVLAGKMYGAGSSRDWAAKGTALLGVRAVIAESYERIHRSNLVEMGVLPLEFVDGESIAGLGLSGREKFSVEEADRLAPAQLASVSATAPDGTVTRFRARVRIDTPIELEYYRHGGILQFVLRNIMKGGC